MHPGLAAGEVDAILLRQAFCIGGIMASWQHAFLNQLTAHTHCSCRKLRHGIGGTHTKEPTARHPYTWWHITAHHSTTHQLSYRGPQAWHQCVGAYEFYRLTEDSVWREGVATGRATFQTRSESGGGGHRRCGHVERARNDSEGIRTPAGRAQWISSPSP